MQLYSRLFQKQHMLMKEGDGDVLNKISQWYGEATLTATCAKVNLILVFETKRKNQDLSYCRMGEGGGQHFRIFRKNLGYLGHFLIVISLIWKTAENNKSSIKLCLLRRNNRKTKNS